MNSEPIHSYTKPCHDQHQELHSILPRTSLSLLKFLSGVHRYLRVWLLHLWQRLQPQVFRNVTPHLSLGGVAAIRLRQAGWEPFSGLLVQLLAGPLQEPAELSWSSSFAILAAGLGTSPNIPSSVSSVFSCVRRRLAAML